MRIKLELFGHMDERTPPNSEAWWWEHDGVELVAFTGAWDHESRGIMRRKSDFWVF